MSLRGSWPHILVQIHPTGLFGSFLSNGCQQTTFLRKAVQTRMGGLGHREAFRYTIAGGYARVLTYSTRLSRRLYSRSRDRIIFRRVTRDRYIQQALFSLSYRKSATPKKECNSRQEPNS